MGGRKSCSAKNPTVQQVWSAVASLFICAYTEQKCVYMRAKVQVKCLCAKKKKSVREVAAAAAALSVFAGRNKSEAEKCVGFFFSFFFLAKVREQWPSEKKVFS